MSLRALGHLRSCLLCVERVDSFHHHERRGHSEGRAASDGHGRGAGRATTSGVGEAASAGHHERTRASPPPARARLPLPATTSGAGSTAAAHCATVGCATVSCATSSRSDFPSRCSRRRFQLMDFGPDLPLAAEQATPRKEIDQQICGNLTCLVRINSYMSRTEIPTRHFSG